MYWIQTLLAKIIGRFHPSIGHNVEKMKALKKAFFWVNMDHTEGDYLEFGVLEGTSMISAMENHVAMEKIYGKQKRTFWGFDSFAGFEYSVEADKHPYWEKGAFKSEYEAVRRRLERVFNNRSKWNLVPGLIEDTVGGKKPKDLGIEKIAIAFIDCDLGEPTRVALEFISSALVEGGIIIFDDYFAYKGNSNKGEAGAFREFCEKHPEFEFRRLFDYGLGSQGFIISRIKS